MTIIFEESTAPVDDPVWKRAVKRAKRAGLAWRVGSWPGFDHASAEHLADETNDLVHEIGHHLAAPRSRQRVAYFGLGHPGDARGASSTICAASSQNEEGRASLLGIGILYECGDRQGAFQMMDDHNWFSLERAFRQHMRHQIIHRELKTSTVRWMHAAFKNGAP